MRLPYINQHSSSMSTMPNRFNCGISPSYDSTNIPFSPVQTSPFNANTSSSHKRLCKKFETSYRRKHGYLAHQDPARDFSFPASLENHWPLFRLAVYKALYEQLISQKGE
ncbi:hypothetical protein VNO77_01872 [Canavalia gladiata]|uniref:Uncharacterized protein n=1 Tax=Canavalia gladiata TaxID=3824 RepID=A0AAN9MX32_CANGL